MEKMSRAVERTNEIVGEYHKGDWTDHSGQNAYWVAFKRGYETAEEDFDMDWAKIRIQMAENFMGNILNSDESFKMKLLDDFLYKEVAQFAVKCADALIEELKKEKYNE